MRATVVVASGVAPADASPSADLCLQWLGAGRNATRSLARLRAVLPSSLPPLAEDLLDLATAVYLSDLALPRGRNERWTRDLRLRVPVREPAFWAEQAAGLTHLLYVLTRDHVGFEFVGRASGAPEEPPVALEPFPADCVALVSGGLDSLAGAVMLLRSGRRPLLVAHQSGNPIDRKYSCKYSDDRRRAEKAERQKNRNCLHGCTPVRQDDCVCGA